MTFIFVGVDRNRKFDIKILYSVREKIRVDFEKKSDENNKSLNLIGRDAERFF